MTDYAAKHEQESQEFIRNTRDAIYACRQRLLANDISREEKRETERVIEMLERSLAAAGVPAEENTITIATEGSITLHPPGVLVDYVKPPADETSAPCESYPFLTFP